MISDLKYQKISWKLWLLYCVDIGLCILSYDYIWLLLIKIFIAEDVNYYTAIGSCFGLGVMLMIFAITKLVQCSFVQVWDVHLDVLWFGHYADAMAEVHLGNREKTPSKVVHQALSIISNTTVDFWLFY